MSEQTDTTGNEEDLSQYKGTKGQFDRWWKELEIVKQSKSQRAFERIGERIVKNYRAAECLTESKSDNSGTKQMYNVLWSNTQIQKPLCYCRMPKVVVERRFKDADPIGRLAAQGAERAIGFNLAVTQDKFNHAIKSAVEDRLLPGRGQCWVRLHAEFIEEKDENGETVLDEIVKPNSEKVMVDYVFWLDYFTAPSRNSFDERWRAKRVYLNREELKKQFPHCANKIDLKTDKRKKLSEEEEEFLAQAEVYEIEDKQGKMRIWICDGYKEAPLKVEPDNLHFNDFFSTPIPLLATTTTDSNYPTPDYKIYERLADEADDIMKQLSEIRDCVRIVGVHAAAFSKDLKNIRDLNNGMTWPSDMWAQWVEKGGFKGVIDWYPFDQAVAAIEPLTNQLQMILSQIDLITGIPDFARGGITDARETAEVQQRKAKWISIKAQEKQADVQRFCREIIGKMGELIFEPGLFSDETINLMVGLNQMSGEDQANWPQALQLLRDDRLSTFRVDIETDSTIATDEEETAGRWMEYMGAITNLVGNIQNVSQFRPELMNPIIESALSAVRALRTGRQVEGSWEKAMKQIEDNDKEALENPPKVPPDPAMLQAQTYAQSEQAKAANEAQKIVNQGMEIQMKGEIAQGEFELKMKELEIKGMEVLEKSDMDKLTHDLKVFKQDFDQALAAERLKVEQYKTVLSEHEKLLEEQRLKSTEMLEMVKLISENKEGDEGSGKGGGSKPPDVHVHIGGSKEINMKRTPDGFNGKVTEVMSPNG